MAEDNAQKLHRVVNSVSLAVHDAPVLPVYAACEPSAGILSETNQLPESRPHLTRIWKALKKYWQEETRRGLTTLNPSSVDGRIVYTLLPRAGARTGDEYSIIASFPDIPAYQSWVQGAAPPHRFSPSHRETEGNEPIVSYPPTYEETKFRHLISAVSYVEGGQPFCQDVLTHPFATARHLTRLLFIEQKGMCDTLIVEVREGLYDTPVAETIRANQSQYPNDNLPSYSVARIEDVMMNTIFPGGRHQLRRNSKGVFVHVINPMKRDHRLERNGNSQTLTIHVYYE